MENENNTPPHTLCVAVVAAPLSKSGAMAPSTHS